MRTAIDTNVISALWSKETIASQMSPLLAKLQTEGGLVISAPVFAELVAHPKSTIKFVDTFLSTTNITVDFSTDEDVWRAAASAFSDYVQRRRKSGNGSQKRLLVDFVIGAHATLRADRLLTLDKSRYQRSFPRLKILP